MEVFNAPRGGGKTTLCVTWVKSVDKGLIVTIHEKEAERVRQRYDLGPHQVISRKRLNSYLPTSGTSIAIDNLDLQLDLPHGLTWEDLTPSGRKKVIPEYIYDLPVRLVTITQQEW